MTLTAPYNPKILVEGSNTPVLEVSPFKKTEWDTDAPTVPGQTVMAFRKTDWDTDNGTADTNVLGFKLTKDEWQ